MKRPVVILVSVLVGAAALAIYFWQLPPAGVEAKGDSETLAWISLSIAALSFLTTLVGLAQKIIDLRAAAGRT